jgi:hypothetical protein
MAKPDIFTPVTGVEKLHPGFVTLMSSPGFAPARPLIREIWAEFPDRDGNFLEQFQTAGFDARIWELFLFAFLSDEAKATFDWRNPSPDFVVTIREQRLCIESVTANASQVAPVIIHGPDENIARVNQQDLYPIRLGSALYSKLAKKYWELPHVAGSPLVIAIQDFHEPESLYHSGSSLWQYLYGIRGTWYFDEAGTLHISEIPVGEHRYGAKIIPSGYFGLPGAEYVSAVLFGNTGTVSKFNRLGFLKGYGTEQNLTLIRRGLRYDHSPNTAAPLPFSYVVGAADAPGEAWAQGLSIFHNPNALYPLPVGLLPAAYHFIQNKALRSYLPDFHPLMSQTVIVMPVNK